MRWPFTPRDWITFFLPGVIMLLSGTLATFVAQNYVAMLGLLIAMATSLVVGIYLSKRDAEGVDHLMRDTAIGVGVFCVNAAIAFAGCATIGIASGKAF